MNATCALFGHSWRWCFALRLRQCTRCLSFDVEPVTRHDRSHSVAPTVPPAAPRGAVPAVTAAAVSRHR